LLRTRPPPPGSTPFPYTTLFRSGLPDAAEGRHGNHLLLVITSDSDNAGRASALRCRCPGVDRVHSNLSRPQLLCEHSCDCVESRSEEHTSELQSLRHLVCRLLLE